MQSKSNIQKWAKIAVDRHKKVFRQFNEGDWSHDEQANQAVSLWLSQAAAVVCCLDWVLGKRTFNEAFKLYDAEELTKMRLPLWIKSMGAPEGTLSIEMETEPPRRIRNSSDVRKILRKANKIHSNVKKINDWHPDQRWHPSFHQRVREWVVASTANIQALDWVCGNRPEGQAFYMFSDQAMNMLEKMSRGYTEAKERKLIGMDTLGSHDHDPEDFG